MPRHTAVHVLDVTANGMVTPKFYRSMTVVNSIRKLLSDLIDNKNADSNENQR